MLLLKNINKINKNNLLLNKTNNLKNLNYTNKRFLNVHEYAGMELMRNFNVKTPKGVVVKSADAAYEAFNDKSFNKNGGDLVIKAQVLAGGRGKGTFKNGFQGGVHIVTNANEARDYAQKMLGETLVTKQTGPEGKPCNKVFLMERLYLRRETYFSILLDRSHNGFTMIGSPKGGTSIEDIAKATPELIFTEKIDIMEGVTDEQCERMAVNLGFEGKAINQAKDIFKNLYELCVKSDATLVEINPLAETPDGDVFVCDSKLNFDDNAEFRQKDIFGYRDRSQEDTREVEASQYGLNYIGLDGKYIILINLIKKKKFKLTNIYK